MTERKACAARWVSPSRATARASRTRVQPCAGGLAAQQRELGEGPVDVRRQRVDTEARRLAALGAIRLRVLYDEGIDHYAVAMRDPEGTEFDIN